MAIRDVVTLGFGSFGTIPYVTRLGFDAQTLAGQFLCVHELTITPVLQGQVSNTPVLQTSETITPVLLAGMELNQCR